MLTRVLSFTSAVAGDPASRAPSAFISSLHFTCTLGILPTVVFLTQTILSLRVLAVSVVLRSQ